MKIDNSRAKTWWHCPLGYWERYVNNLEPANRNGDALSFGTRVHQLLEEHHGGEEKGFTPLVDGVLEAEAQLTIEAYKAYYPTEEFRVIECERYFEVGLPCPECLEHPCRPGCERDLDHIYCGEFDMIVEMKESGRKRLFETKTEKRGGRQNHPVAWQQKSQVGLYLWAAQQVYGEEFEGIILNVITRQSPKGECQPSFRRDDLVRTHGQQQEAVKNITWVADQIDLCERTGYYATNRNNCVEGFGWQCDYMPLHSTEERSEELIQIRYKQAEQYLAGI